jgi:hypothetical protein
MYYYAFIGYVLWRHFYVLEYTYNILYYINFFRRIISKPKKLQRYNDEWVLLEYKEPAIIISEI